MFIADVECKFDDGSTGAKQFTARSRDGVYAKVDNFLNRLVHYPNYDDALSQLIGHKVHVYEDDQLEFAGQVIQIIRSRSTPEGLGSTTDICVTDSLECSKEKDPRIFSCAKNLKRCPMYRTEKDIEREKLRHMEFKLERLQEKVERLEREIANKADKMRVYEYWD